MNREDPQAIEPVVQGRRQINGLPNYNIQRFLRNVTAKMRWLVLCYIILSIFHPELFHKTPNEHAIAIRNDDFDCFSAECEQTARAAKDRMNFSVDPCDDFYSYACGGFIKNTTIPDGKDSVNTFSVIDDLLQGQLLSIVSDEIHENEDMPFKLPNNLYKLCMNKSKIEDQGVQPLLDILDRLGGWPILKGDDWSLNSSWFWDNSLKDLHKLGYSANYFFNISVGVDLKNDSRRIIYLDQASLGLSREYLVKGRSDLNVSAYYNSMVDMAVFLGAEKERAEEELRHSLIFEMALAKLSLPSEKRRNTTALYNPMTVKELQSKYPYTSWDWVDYLNVMLMDTGIVIDENEIIVVNAPSYMKKLGPYLESSVNRTLANYVMWRVVSFSSTFLPEKLQQLQQQHRAILSPEQLQEHRSKDCLDVTTKRLPIAVGALYIRQYFNDDAKRAALDMVKEIKKVFAIRLMMVDWMDETTRESALEKLDAMVVHIGYPEELRNDNEINEFYSTLDFIPEDIYLSTILNMDRFVTANKFKKLRQPVNKTDWTAHSNPAVINARYSFIRNSIQFPAGILQGQLFSHHLPNYMNYGAIGMIIGREITRAITRGVDHKDRVFDKNGDPVGWWGKARCIARQYKNYREPNVNMSLRGFNTKSQNIADNSGLQVAYYAYKKWAEKNEPVPRLPIHNLKPKQMFWLAAAQTWCAVYQPEALEELVLSGTSSPSQFRVLGSMSNMVEFSDDFNCPDGSPMNPEKKCNIW